VTQPEVETLRSSYEALNRGDPEAALQALHPDGVWRESAELPGGTELKGRGAVLGFLEDFLAQWREFRQEVEDIVVADDRVAVVIHLTAVGRASGIEVDTRYAHVWTLRGGKGVEVDAYRDPETALRALAGAR
jgi:ketosteroid isomerase-like protein